MLPHSCPGALPPTPPPTFPHPLFPSSVSVTKASRVSDSWNLDGGVAWWGGGGVYTQRRIHQQGNQHWMSAKLGKPVGVSVVLWLSRWTTTLCSQRNRKLYKKIVSRHPCIRGNEQSESRDGHTRLPRSLESVRSLWTQSHTELEHITPQSSGVG